MFDSNPNQIDYHCHLDLYQDYARQFETCENQRMATLAVTTTPRAWKRNMELAADSRFVRVALGFHPQLVSQIAEEMPLFESLVSRSPFVGEVGLDASPSHYASFQKQRAIFARILKLCAEQGGKILSVHSVRAVQSTLDLIEQHLPSNRGKVVLHWFSGSSIEARRAVDLGCYFSLNKEMFRIPSRHRLIASLPFDRILTETDGPFVSTENGLAQPKDVYKLLPVIANVFQKTDFEVRARLLQNLHNLETEITR